MIYMKKALLFALMLAMLAAVFPASAERPPADVLEQIVFKPGDVDNNGVVDIADVLAIRDIIFDNSWDRKWGEGNIDAADVAEPFGTVDIDDLLLVIDHIFGRVDLWAGLTVPEVAEWKQAYYEILRDPYNSMPRIHLIDLNFDGIRELLLATLGNVNSFMMKGYSFQNGQLISFDLDLLGLPTRFALMKDNATKEISWLAYDTFRSGPGCSYHNENVWVDFDDFAQVKSRPFFDWMEVNCPPAQDFEKYPDFETYYIYYAPDGKEQQLPPETIQAMKLQALDNYEEMPIKQHTAFGLPSQSDYADVPDPEVYYSIMKFFEQWEKAPLALSNIRSFSSFPAAPKE